jgi:(hydroxyamino)benzene mutase
MNDPSRHTDEHERYSATARRGLVRHGVLLFLAGLVTGFLVPLAANPRAGLAGHLEGVMNGTFLLALGCAWSELRLGARAGRIVYALVLFGSWANWAATLLSAFLGTSKATPLAGAGHAGTPFQENLVYGVLGAVSVAMVVAMVVAARGAWRREPTLPG